MTAARMAYWEGLRRWDTLKSVPQAAWETVANSEGRKLTIEEVLARVGHCG
jgi:hypothetical protein